MIFKEKMYLANCDSTRKLNADEFEKRFLTSAVFSQGIILSPNIILDNPSVVDILRSARVKKWFKEEGSGSIVVRGVGVTPSSCLVEYFDSLPDNFVISSMGGLSKTEIKCTDAQGLDALRKRLELIQEQLFRFDSQRQNLLLDDNSLSNEILRQHNDSWDEKYFLGKNSLEVLHEKASVLTSRSDWYEYISYMGDCLNNEFRVEVVDTAYSRLFLNKGEAFCIDRINFLGGIPNQILHGGLGIRAMKKQREWLSSMYSIFGIVTNLGTEELVKVLADEAIGYMEDKAEDSGIDWLCRKNWFGLYGKLSKKVGVELI